MYCVISFNVAFNCRLQDWLLKGWSRWLNHLWFKTLPSPCNGCSCLTYFCMKKENKCLFVCSEPKWKNESRNEVTILVWNHYSLLFQIYIMAKYHYRHTDLTQYWWIVFRRRAFKETSAQWLDYNTNNKKQKRH